MLDVWIPASDSNHRARPINSVSYEAGTASVARERADGEKMVNVRSECPEVHSLPSAQDVKKRNATHLPQRSWCPVCVKRGQHTRQQPL